jgi:hypothetical protein
MCINQVVWSLQWKSCKNLLKQYVHGVYFSVYRITGMACLCRSFSSANYCYLKFLVIKKSIAKKNHHWEGWFYLFFHLTGDLLTLPLFLWRLMIFCQLDFSCASWMYLGKLIKQNGGKLLKTSLPNCIFLFITLKVDLTYFTLMVTSLHCHFFLMATNDISQLWYSCAGVMYLTQSLKKWCA